MSNPTSRFRDALPWTLLLGVLLGGIWLARRERRSPGGRPARVVTARTIRLPAPPDLPPASAEMREAAADLERSAERARTAAAELERVKADLEEQRQSLEAVKQDADANAERTRRELEDARGRLETQRAGLEKASREAEERVRKARRDLERLQERQLRGAAAASRPPPGLGMQIEARPGVTMEQAVRIAAMAVPPRLSEVELDPRTGEIGWPRILLEPAYADLTGRIESAFRERAIHGGSLSHAGGVEVERAIDRLAERLRADVGRHSAGRYGAAQNFLDRLRAEFLRSLEN